MKRAANVVISSMVCPLAFRALAPASASGAEPGVERWDCGVGGRWQPGGGSTDDLSYTRFRYDHGGNFPVMFGASGPIALPSEICPRLVPSNPR